MTPCSSEITAKSSIARRQHDYCYYCGRQPWPRRRAPPMRGRENFSHPTRNICAWLLRPDEGVCGGLLHVNGELGVDADQGDDGKDQ
eukprot:530606-Pyramimonas_sp.AAC.1